MMFRWWTENYLTGCEVWLCKTKMAGWNVLHLARIPLTAEHQRIYLQSSRQYGTHPITQISYIPFPKTKWYLSNLAKLANQRTNSTDLENGKVRRVRRTIVIISENSAVSWWNNMDMSVHLLIWYHSCICNSSRDNHWKLSSLILESHISYSH